MTLPRSSIKPDFPALEHFRNLLDAARRNAHLFAPGDLIPGLGRNLGAIRRLRASGGSVSPELLGLAAGYADMLSSLYQEADDPVRAGRWIDKATEWAQVGRQFPMVSYLFVRKSNLTWWRNDPLTTLDNARAAHSGAWAVPTAVRAAAVQHEARAYAQLGDERQCVIRLEKAARLAEQGHGEEEPRFLSGTVVGSYTPEYFDVLSGMCYSDLGQGRRAVEILETRSAFRPAGARGSSIVDE